MRDFDNIPEIMKEQNHWVLWKQEIKDGKLSKIPYQINDRKAMSNNPDTWTSFTNAMKGFYERPYDGIGFQLSGSGITGIDIDHCIEDGRISSHAQEIISLCSSYTEISPSGTGIHIYIQGDVPTAIHTKTIEIYSTRRYLTVTGDKLNDLNVQPRQGVLDQLYKKYAKENLTENIFLPRIGRVQQPRQSDNEILQIAFDSQNGSKIKALYDGDWSKYISRSEADLALCRYLAFWLDGDFNRIDYSFRSSGLYREKWDRPDYRSRTIYKAISGCTQSLTKWPRATAALPTFSIVDNSTPEAIGAIMRDNRKIESEFSFFRAENHEIHKSRQKIGGNIMEDQDLIKTVVCRGCHDDYHEEATRDGYCLACYEQPEFEDEDFDE